MKKYLQCFKIGWLTPSYGQLIDVIAALEIIDSAEIRLKNNVIWYFPYRKEFPFIFGYLKTELNITSSKAWFLIYRVLSKIKLRYFLASISDFAPIAQKLYKNNIYPTKLIKFLHGQEDSFILAIKQEFASVQFDRLCLVYCRDSSWDSRVANLINNEVAKKNQFRNASNSVLEGTLLTSAIQNFSILKIGRSTLRTVVEPKNFFDYSSNIIQSDGMDLFLWSKAKVAISTGGGANQPAFLFSVPILFLDFAENLNVNVNLTSKKLYMLPQIYVDYNYNKISIRELINLGLLDSEEIAFRTDLSEYPMYRIHNSVECIQRAVDDFLNKPNDTLVWDFQLHEHLAISKTWKNIEVCE